MDQKGLQKKEVSKSIPDISKDIGFENTPTEETPAVVEALKAVPEVVASSESETMEPLPVVQEPTVMATLTPTPSPTHASMDKLESEIENVLEEDLKEMYLAMPPEKQAEFKAKGEQTRSAVRMLVRSAHANAKKIFRLIRVWLTLIPGVNRFFLEQEAKIKTDKILMVTDEEKRRGSKERV